MIVTIIIVLFVLWLAGFIGLNITGGFIHILVVVAIVLLIFRLIRGE